MKLKSLTLSGVALATLISAGFAFAPVSAADVLGGVSTGSSVGAATNAAGSLPQVPTATAPDAGADVGADLRGTTGSTDIGAAAGAEVQGSAPAEIGADVGATTDPAVTAPIAGAQPGVASDITGSVGAAASATGAAGVPVTSVENVASTLPNATLQSKDGVAIGTIEKVSVGESGQADIVSVKLSEAVSGRNNISLQTDQLTFDQGNNIVVSSLTQSELKSLAAAQR